MRLLDLPMRTSYCLWRSAGRFDEFDRNEFFAASGESKKRIFKHKYECKSAGHYRGQ